MRNRVCCHSRVMQWTPRSVLYSSVNTPLQCLLFSTAVSPAWQSSSDRYGEQNAECLNHRESSTVTPGHKDQKVFLLRYFVMQCQGFTQTQHNCEVTTLISQRFKLINWSEKKHMSKVDVICLFQTLGRLLWFLSLCVCVNPSRENHLYEFVCFSLQSFANHSKCTVRFSPLKVTVNTVGLQTPHCS